MVEPQERRASVPIRWNPQVFPVRGTRGLLRLPDDGALLAAQVRPCRGGVAAFCTRSRDGGRTWDEIGQLAFDPEPQTDLGDGALLRTRAGALLYAYRHNRYRGPRAHTPDYAIRVAASRDGGRSWAPHSTVTAHAVSTSEAPSRGLWAPSLFETPEERLQCYYDDERTPHAEGYPGHQWLMMRTWDPGAGAWRGTTVVSRAHEPKHLSRDGMGTVIALSPRRLLCAFESVQVRPPHANLIRLVMSEDAGATWSWRRRERDVLYQPAERDHMALAPYLTRLGDGTLACLFCTDEDRERPDRSGTPPHRLNMDVKLVTRRSGGGGNWSAAQTVTESHRAYLPGLVEVGPGRVLAVWVDFGKDGGSLGRLGNYGNTAEPPPSSAGARGGGSV